MAPSHHVAAPVLVLLLLLVATGEMGTTKVAEARECESQSQRFKGLCVSSNTCANACNIEGFSDGECKTDGPTRKCFCKKEC